MSGADSQPFNQADVDSFVFLNQAYNVIPVKIRLKDTKDPDAINLGPDNSLSFEVHYSTGKAKFYYTGKEVQMIDLNNGDASDDLNTPNSDYNSYNTLRYDPGKPQGATDVINFDANIFQTRFTDNDGVAGGGAALFTQIIKGSAIQCAIKKLV